MTVARFYWTRPSPSASCRMEPSYQPLRTPGRIPARTAPTRAGSRSGAGQAGPPMLGCRSRLIVGATSRTGGTNLPGNARVGTRTPSWWQRGIVSGNTPKNPQTRSDMGDGDDLCPLPGSGRRGVVVRGMQRHAAVSRMCHRSRVVWRRTSQSSDGTKKGLAKARRTA